VSILGATLMPVIQSLMPVLVQVGTAIVEIVRSVMPLLQPIANLISTVIGALAPALTPVIAVTEQLVSVLVGPLTQVVQALTPVLVTIAEVISQVFQALQPLLAPLVLLLGQVAQIIAGVFATAIKQLMTAFQPLIKVGIQLIKTVFAALAPLLPVINQAFTMLGDALVTMIPALSGFADAGITLVKALAPLIPIGVQLVTAILKALLPVLPVVADTFGILAGALVEIVGPLAGVVASLVSGLAPILSDLAPVLGGFVGLLADTLAQVLPPLAGALVTLVRALAPLLPLVGQLLGIVLSMAAGVLRQLLPSLLELVQANVQLMVAILPLIPPLTTVISLVLRLAVGILSRLLPPIVKLAGFLVGAFAAALSTVIGWVTGVIKTLAGLVSFITTKVGPAFTWLSNKVIKPTMSTISSVISGTWKYGIKPVFDGLNLAVKAIATGFDLAQKAIKVAWEKLRGIAKAPVDFIVNTVYGKGIRGVWNTVAGAFGAPKLPAFKYASGGVLPGYTPGRDPHKFYSPTGGSLEMSGGEAIMRPEFTRAVGPGFVSYFNSLAKSGGAEGVRRQLAPLLGGNPATPTDRSLRFADGGIFGWIKSAGSAALGAGSAAWNKIKQSASWLKDTLEASAVAGVKKVVNPLLKSFPGMDTGFGQMLRKIPDRIISALTGYSKEADKQGGGGLGGPKIQSALRWAKTQAGLPYQWAGNGNPSWDCSGFMSAIESVLRGQNPHRRWATMAFSGKTAPPGWVLNGNSPFRIGITNAGVGHTAGTIGGTNVESRGGDGVVVGPRARGYKDKLFTSWYGFQPGKYDAGGFLQPGFNLAYNGTGKPEPVLTGAQFNAMARTEDAPITVEIHTQDRALAEFIDVRVHRNNEELISVINAS
jgi:phage-related protein